ncbi:hypothetical protein [Niabella aquatica]
MKKMISKVFSFAMIMFGGILLLSLPGCKKDNNSNSEDGFATVWAPIGGEGKYEVTAFYDGAEHKYNIDVSEKDYLSLKTDGNCNGYLYPLGKFTGKWRKEGNKILKIDQATVENASVLDNPASFDFELSNTESKSMRIRLRVNKKLSGIQTNKTGNILLALQQASVSPQTAASTSSNYTDIALELVNLYNKSLGMGYLAFDNQAYFIKSTVAANQDRYGNTGFYIYGYGIDRNGERMQMFVRWDGKEVHPPQAMVFGAQGFTTLMHVQWYYDGSEQINNSRERTFGANGEQISVTSDGRSQFILTFNNLTEMDKWNAKPKGNGVKASGYIRGNAVF